MLGYWGFTSFPRRSIGTRNEKNIHHEVHEEKNRKSGKQTNKKGATSLVRT